MYARTHSRADASACCLRTCPLPKTPVECIHLSDEEPADEGITAAATTGSCPVATGRTTLRQEAPELCGSAPRQAEKLRRLQSAAQAEIQRAVCNCATGSSAAGPCGAGVGGRRRDARRYSRCLPAGQHTSLVAIHRCSGSDAHLHTRVVQWMVCSATHFNMRTVRYTGHEVVQSP